MSYLENAKTIVVRTTDMSKCYAAWLFHVYKGIPIVFLEHEKDLKRVLHLENPLILGDVCESDLDKFTHRVIVFPASHGEHFLSLVLEDVRNPICVAIAKHLESYFHGNKPSMEDMAVWFGASIKLYARGKWPRSMPADLKRLVGVVTKDDYVGIIKSGMPRYHEAMRMWNIHSKRAAEVEVGSFVAISCETDSDCELSLLELSKQSRDGVGLMFHYDPKRDTTRFRVRVYVLPKFADTRPSAVQVAKMIGTSVRGGQHTATCELAGKWVVLGKKLISVSDLALQLALADARMDRVTERLESMVQRLGAIAPKPPLDQGNSL